MIRTTGDPESVRRDSDLAPYLGEDLVVMLLIRGR